MRRASRPSSGLPASRKRGKRPKRESALLVHPGCPKGLRLVAIDRDPGNFAIAHRPHVREFVFNLRGARPAARSLVENDHHVLAGIDELARLERIGVPKGWPLAPEFRNSSGPRRSPLERESHDGWISTSGSASANSAPSSWRSNASNIERTISTFCDDIGLDYRGFSGRSVAELCMRESTNVRAGALFGRNGLRQWPELNVGYRSTTPRGQAEPRRRTRRFVRSSARDVPPQDSSLMLLALHAARPRGARALVGRRIGERD